MKSGVDEWREWCEKNVLQLEWAAERLRGFLNDGPGVDEAIKLYAEELCVTEATARSHFKGIVNNYGALIRIYPGLASPDRILKRIKKLEMVFGIARVPHGDPIVEFVESINPNFRYPRTGKEFTFGFSDTGAFDKVATLREVCNDLVHLQHRIPYTKGADNRHVEIRIGENGVKYVVDDRLGFECAVSLKERIYTPEDLRSSDD